MHTSLLTLLQSVSLLCATKSVTAADGSKSSSTIFPLTAAAYGTTFNADVVIGGQSFPLLVDTGSSDLWVLQEDYECFYGSATWSGNPVPREKCINGNKTYTQSSTFSPIESAWLGEHYGTGNVGGPLGFESVQVGSISIPRQTTGFVNSTTSYGDGRSSGILGLGYPVIASRNDVFSGITDHCLIPISVHPANYTATTSLQLLKNRLLYDTLLVSITKQVEPYFAFALERTPLQQEIGFGGYISFRTLPPVAHGEWITAPVEITKTIPAWFTNGTGKISEWTLTVESVTWEGRTDSAPFQAVVDTGNWLNTLPEAVATKINAEFDPPAGEFDEVEGYYPVECDAKPPANTGIQIGGKMISVSSEDVIWRDWTGQCYSTVSATIPYAGIALNFLGDAFLKNVVAVFDYGNDEMRFAQRIEHNSDNPVPSTNAASELAIISYVLSVAAVLAAIAFAY